MKLFCTLALLVGQKVIAKQVILALSCCVITQSIGAQMMVETMMKGQVLTTTKQGKVGACGIRIVGIPLAATGKTVRMFDGSLNLLSNGNGLGKIIVSEGPLLPPDPSKMMPVKVLGVWMKAQGKDAAAPVTDLIPGETPMSALFVSRFQPTLDTLHAMGLKELVQVGIKISAGVETIYFGRVELSDAEREQFYDCLAELAK